jgi:hypothetical protein
MMCSLLLLPWQTIWDQQHLHINQALPQLVKSHKLSQYNSFLLLLGTAPNADSASETNIDHGSSHSQGTSGLFQSLEELFEEDKQWEDDLEFNEAKQDEEPRIVKLTRMMDPRVKRHLNYPKKATYVSQ